jgi:RNA-directed DNA polymerase
VSATPKPQGEAVYAASSAEKDWLLNEQRKLYKRSLDNPDYTFQKLWGLITDPRNLRIALARVAGNKGKRTAGVDGKTVRTVMSVEGAGPFVERLREALRKGEFSPSPVRRVLLPKTGQAGKFRPLGIPTVADRVIQAAVKNILEPIFEADFYASSFGFRPGKSAHAALEYVRLLLRPRRSGTEQGLPYQWAVEGDIKGCFDNIDHHALMNRIRRRIGDGKVLRLVRAFLKAGVLSERQILRTPSGTPQGGILSPLLANIALATIEERYERHAWPRTSPTLLTDPEAIQRRARKARDTDRNRGRCIYMPIRYADDFIILVGAPPDQRGKAERLAHEEKAALGAALLQEWGLELSSTKTLVTPVTTSLRFLGHHVRVRRHPTTGQLVSAAVIPKERSHRTRESIKRIFDRSTTYKPLSDRLRALNYLLRGWAYFYRHAWGAKHVFGAMDHYVWWTIFRWLQKKHPNMPKKKVFRTYGVRGPQGGVRWHEGDERPFQTSTVRVEHFKLGWMKTPDFANTDGEPGA